MPRRRTTAAAEPALPVVPHIIDERAVYSVEQAQRALGLRRSTVAREYREGRLRISKRAGRHYLLGAWLLEWLAAGELKRKRQPVTAEH